MRLDDGRAWFRAFHPGGYSRAHCLGDSISWAKAASIIQGIASRLRGSSWTVEDKIGSNENEAYWRAFLRAPWPDESAVKKRAGPIIIDDPD
jgi:hypothetical protein